jgi:hypothetical protein
MMGDEWKTMESQVAPGGKTTGQSSIDRSPPHTDTIVATLSHEGRG